MSTAEVPAVPGPVDDTLLWIFAGVNLVVALALTVWVPRRQDGPGERALGVSVLAGGLLAPLLCPLWDVLTHVRHYTPADTTVCASSTTAS